MKDQVLAYLILEEANCEYKQVYVPNKALFYFKNKEIIDFKEDKLEFEKTNYLVSAHNKGLIKKINVNNQKIQFLIDTGRKLEKIKIRFKKQGNSLIELIERDSVSPKNNSLLES